jgi:hypothetical protein
MFATNTRYMHYNTGTAAIWISNWVSKRITVIFFLGLCTLY